MVAERRLTAMKLLEEGAVELIGRASLPNSTQNQEKEVLNGVRVLTAGDPDLPCWGSLGKPNVGEEVLNPQWLFQGVEAAVV